MEKAMNKKLILWFGALAMTGLTACNETEPIQSNCTNNEQICAQGSVYICSNGVWKIEKQCLVGEFCNETTLTCEPSMQLCTEGATRCSADGQIERCIDKTWSASNCEAGQVCVSGKTACEDKVCNEGEVVCSNNNETSACVNNKWVEKTCDSSRPLCKDGKCVACVDGHNRCADHAVETCNEGAWEVVKLCSDSDHCIENVDDHTATCVECINDKKRCENNAIEVCADNVWTTQEACGSETCNPTTYVCENVEGCTAGWERCNGNVVEVCDDDGQYAPVNPAACVDNSYCLSDTINHTAGCVECKENSDCQTAKAPICHSDNTCVACVPFDKKCHESDGTLILCDENGAWETSGTTCEGGLTCLPGGNDCTPNAGYCDSNDDCDTLHGICRNNSCTCDVGQESCIVEDGQAKYSICESWAFGWTPYVNCEASAPVCNDAQTKCVECTEDSHCKGEGKCDKTNNTCTVVNAWDHVVDLEDCDAVTSYKAVTCASGITFTRALHDPSNSIEGTSIRMDKNSSATLTAPNGVGKLSIDVKKVFGQTANVTIKVGGLTAITRLGMAPDTLETMVNDTVNASGPVDIVISTTHFIVIDNLKWTNHP